MKKFDKQELKGPDAFVSGIEKAWHEVEKFRTTVFAVIAIFALGGGGYSIYNWQKNKSELQAQSDYYVAKKSLMDAQKDYLPPEELEEVTKSNKDKKQPPKAAKTKSGNLEQDLGDSVGKLETVVKNHKGTRAAVLAALDLSNVFQEYKQPDRAIQNLNAVMSNTSTKELLFGFVNLQLGNAYQATGKCDEAIKAWKTVSTSKDHSFLHADALLKEGLCQEILGQKDKAAETYRKVSQDFSDTDAGKSAKTYLRLLNNEGT